MSKLETLQYAGVALGGGKADRTAVAILEYFPQQKRIFLKQLVEKIKGSKEQSADEALHEILSNKEAPVRMVAFDAPLQLPHCPRCILKCPGVDNCRVPAVQWMNAFHQNNNRKKTVKMFTPYTERAAEMFLAQSYEERFFPSHALGANAAPLAARAQYLLRRLRLRAIEVYPRASIWRIGRALGVSKNHLRYHKHSVDGDEARQAVLRAVVENNIAFVYSQDFKTMIENNQAFEAFISALVAYLKDRGQTETPPKDYPKGESWFEVPKQSIEWFAQT